MSGRAKLRTGSNFVLAAIAEGLGRTKRSPVLWCFTSHAAHEWGHPYGPGLLALGLDPALFLIVEARTEKDAAWALEEGLKGFEGTVIAVTHDRWFTRSFDRFVLFRGDGEVVETPEPVWDVR